MTVAGIVLAGGLARRMGGGDKSLRRLGDRPVLDWVVERLRPQVAALALNANGDAARFAAWGLPVAADSVADFPGPLAGVLAGLDWAAALPGVTHVASVASDTPFLPRDLVTRLAAALADGAHDIACAASGSRRHPVFALWPVALREDLRRALVEEGLHKVDRWTGRYRVAAVEFAALPVDPFFNVNEPADLAVAERLCAALPDM